MPATRRTADAKEPTIDLEPLMAKWPAKERTRIEKHLALSDAEPEQTGRGKLWRRLAAALTTLAPLPPQTLGNLAVLFFIPDGKYRMQVFTLEDAGDGDLLVFLPDVLADAQKKKIIGKPKQEGEYTIGGAATKILRIESMDASNTPSPPPQVKNLIGWNRKAIKVKLPVNDTDDTQLKAAEALFELAAKKWAPPAN